MNCDSPSDLVLHIQPAAPSSQHAAGERDQQLGGLQSNVQRQGSSDSGIGSSSSSSSSSSPSHNLSSHRHGGTLRTVDSSSSMLTHFFVESKKLDLSVVESELDRITAAREVPEPVVPPRITVHTKMHINAMMCAALTAVLIMSYWSSISTILRFQRWYAVVVLALVPVGAYFFSFAVNTAVCGVFSVFLGECSKHCQRTH
jgi:hypothetical protein